MATVRGFRTIKIAFQSDTAAIYTSARKADALQKIMEEMPLFDGVKLMEVLEAAYVQGRKDGARAAFEEIDQGVNQAKKAIPHVPPGRPRKSK